MRRNILRLVALIAVLALVAAACGDGTADETTTTTSGDAQTTTTADTSGDTTTTTESGPVEVPSSPDDGVTDDTIKIGFMGDITGPTAATQDPFNVGIKAYLDFANQEGGVAGRQFELITKDDTYAVEPALTNFRSLVDDERVLTILGQGGSHIITALDQDIQDAGVPFIGQQQTVDIQFENPLIFNTLAHYGDQADVVVERMIEDVGGVENLVVSSVGMEVASGEEWGVYIGDTVTKRGGTYTGHLRIPIQGSDADAQVVELKQLVDNEGVNYVALHGSPSAALRLLHSMDKQGVDLPVGGIFAVIAESVYLEGPEGLLDTYWGVHTYTPSNISNPGNDELNAFVAGTGYEAKAANVNFVGGWVVGKVTVEGIRRAAETGTLTRQTLVDAMNSLKDFDTGGQSPAMDCTRPGHHCGAAARPYDWDGSQLVADGTFDDWLPTIDFIYGLGG